MKRNLIIVLVLLMSSAVVAQKKPKIGKANILRENGDLAGAKEIIDQAITHEKTMNLGKTWYYRGLIYASIDTSSNPQYATLAENAIVEAMNAFNKADEIDPEGKKYYITNDAGFPVLKSQQINDYWSYYYNNGVDGFQNNRLEEAVKNFECAYTIMPNDTNSYVNAAYAAHNGEMYESAAKNYRLAINIGNNDPEFYGNYIDIVNTGLKDKEQALTIADEAIKLYPTDGGLQKRRIQLYIDLDRIDEAKADLIKTLEAEPDNVSLLFTLGALNDETGDLEGAKEAYKRAIEVDPDNYESNFNLAVILINDANEVLKQRNNLGLSKADRKKEKELIPVIDKKMEVALPQWKRVYEIRPTDKTAVETLTFLYNYLDMKDEYKKMNAILESME